MTNYDDLKLDNTDLGIAETQKGHNRAINRVDERVKKMCEDNTKSKERDSPLTSKSENIQEHLSCQDEKDPDKKDVIS